MGSCLDSNWSLSALTLLTSSWEMASSLLRQWLDSSADLGGPEEQQRTKAAFKQALFLLEVTQDDLDVWTKAIEDNAMSSNDAQEVVAWMTRALNGEPLQKAKRRKAHYRPEFLSRSHWEQVMVGAFRRSSGERPSQMGYHRPVQGAPVPGRSKVSEKKCVAGIVMIVMRPRWPLGRAFLESIFQNDP